MILRPLPLFLVGIAAVCIDLTAFESVAREASSNPSRSYGLPSQVTAEHFSALLESSPFTRSLDRAESVRLTGVAEIDGIPVVTLFDRETKKTKIVSAKPTSDGWKMVSVEKNQDLAQVSATIAVGGEEFTLQFDESQLQPQRSGRYTEDKNNKTPRGPDRRPLPTEEEKRKFGEWVRQRMGKMSEQQRQQVGKIMGDKMRANPDLSDRQKGEIFVQILDYVEKQGGRK